MDIPVPKYKVGDAVAFRDMCQPNYPPFAIQQVDANMFDVRYMVCYKWWHESNLIPYHVWRSAIQHNPVDKVLSV